MLDESRDGDNKAFHSYFLNQNARIANDDISGIPIRLTSLGIGNGLTVSSLGLVYLTDLIMTRYSGFVTSVSASHKICSFESVSHSVSRGENMNAIEPRTGIIPWLRQLKLRVPMIHSTEPVVAKIR